MNLQIAGLKVDVGEGSRGGKVIGHTTSGKPIYLRSHPSHKTFTEKEHQEAADKHYALSVKYQGTTAEKHFTNRFRAHKNAANPEGRAFSKSAVEAGIGKKSSI